MEREKRKELSSNLKEIVCMGKKAKQVFRGSREGKGVTVQRRERLYG